MDLACASYETFDALSEYCRRVASAVGLICLEIFGYKDPSARAYAARSRDTAGTVPVPDAGPDPEGFVAALARAAERLKVAARRS